MPGKFILIVMLGILIPLADVASGLSNALRQVANHGPDGIAGRAAGYDSVDVFEGTLHYNLEINGIKQDLRYRIRQGRVRIEIDDPHMGGTMTILVAPADERMVVLMHELQSYSDLTLDEITGRSDYLMNQVNKLVPTGEVQEIGGITAYEYQLTTDNGEILRIWSPGKSTRYGMFQFPGFIDRMMSHMLKNEMAKDLFPFSISFEGNRNTVNITLTDIQEEQLTMELFTVPANYRKLLVTIPD